MSRKKKYGFFHIGKNKLKYGTQDKPMQGEPNSNLDTYSKKTGRFHSRRKYGASGNAVVDLDVATNVHKDDHAHDIKGNDRSTDRPLTKKERREVNKAKRKRRFWNNGK